ncbi:MAG: NHL repeat-containing protein, partial [Candidatus Geothermincolia bacterium]
NVSTGTIGNYVPQIALDSSGNPKVVWYGNDGATTQIYYAENTGSGWTPQKVSTGGTTANFDQQIALDSAGNPNVVWRAWDGVISQIYYAENTGSGWTPQKVSTGTTTNNVTPDIALDSDGNPNVVWYGNDGSTEQVYYAENTGSGWTPQKVSAGTTTGNIHQQIALDSGGNPNVVWSGNDGVTNQVYYAENTGGGWTPQKVSTGTIGNYVPQIALDSSGNPKVVWRGSDGSTNQVYYAENTGGGWTPQKISIGTSTSNQSQQIALGSAGNPNVVWSGNDGVTDQVYYSMFTTAPTVTTTAVSNITLTGATSGGNVTFDGGEPVTARGVCWSTSHSPNTSNSHTHNGSGEGTFTSNVTGCAPDTTYYVRAYATNALGASYGSERSFRTAEVSRLSTWYLAEGTTAWGFSTYISILNPNSTPVNAEVTYMPKGASNVSETVTLPASSQTTITNDHLVAKMGGTFDFSTRVEATDASKAIAVDRTMEWGGEGAGQTGLGSYPEGHSSVGVTAPAAVWYLPEGSTKWGFETWLLIQNPSGTEASCDVTYMIEGEDPETVTHTVPAHSRESYSMQEDVGYKDASIKVASDIPVIPERAMYRNNRREGHDSIGTTTPAIDYYLAEGAVGYSSEYVTYVLVQNPHSSATAVTITYLTGSGAVPGPSFTMDPNSRKTIRVNDQLPPNTDVSTSVHGSDTIIAERAMNWDGPGWVACHDSIGMSAPARTFYLPDGQSSEARETWTLVQNPNDTAVSVTITYLTPSGTGNVIKTEVIPANSRKTFNMEEHSGLNARASIMVRSATLPIMCERAMYWSDRSAGTDTIGGWSN